MNPFDLTPAEQANVRAAVRYLKTKIGGWREVQKVLHSGRFELAKGRVHPMIAFKVARIAKVGVDDVLTGRYPPEGVCRHCGHEKEDLPQALT